MQYTVEKRERQWYILGLTNPNSDEAGYPKREDTLIFPGLNHSTNTPDGLMSGMYEQLYTELQINDNLKEGDIFVTPVGQFICSGVHVLPYDQQAKDGLAALKEVE